MIHIDIKTLTEFLSEYLNINIINPDSEEEKIINLEKYKYHNLLKHNVLELFYTLKNCISNQFFYKFRKTINRIFYKTKDNINLLLSLYELLLQFDIYINDEELTIYIYQLLFEIYKLDYYKHY